tara:strand:+ start:132 stop:1052 length:921 start_codon:yes stop_codon:yes gene_type:complete
MKILFIDKVHSFLRRKLEEKNYTCDTAYNKTKTEVEKIIHNYNGIIIRSRFIIDQEFINKAVKLKFIARAGSGMESIDTQYAISKKIKCYNAPEGNRQAVAEHAIGMILSLINNIHISNSEIKKGIWEREKNRGTELANKTIGIIGYGNNGSALANMLKMFNVKILIYDKYIDNYNDINNLKNIYENADILSLHIPLNQETYHIINQETINQFKKPFYVINTSRGGCVNTKDLVLAMKEKKIKGACLDVIEYEKSSFNKLDIIKNNNDMKYLIKSKNTILTSHIAGLTKESNIKIAENLFRKIMLN